MSQRKAVTLKKAAAYRRGDRGAKSRILDELIELTGWHRDYCRAAISACRAGPARPVKPRRPRPAVYGPETIAALVIVWQVTRFPAGKRLAPMLATVVPLLVRDGDLDLDAAAEALLVQMSAATIDRKLQPERAKLATVLSWLEPRSAELSLTMKTIVVRYQAKPDRADENQQLIEELFAELDEHQPEGFTYKSSPRRPRDFVHVLIEHAALTKLATVRWRPNHRRTSSAYFIGVRAEGNGQVGSDAWSIPQEELDRFVATRRQTRFRPGYDMTLRPPKSVSVLWALGDEGIVLRFATRTRRRGDRDQLAARLPLLRGRQ